MALDLTAEAAHAFCSPNATLRATAKAAKLPSLFHAVHTVLPYVGLTRILFPAADSSRIRVFPERELALTFLTGRLEAFDISTTCNYFEQYYGRNLIQV